MANPHKGEVAFECDGVPYTLRFSANALCELEDALDAGINEIAVRLSDPNRLRLKTIRAALWAGLRDRHSAVTLQDAGEIVTKLSLAKSLELLGQAFEAAFPNADGTPGHPQQPGPEAGPATESGPGTGKT